MLRLTAGGFMIDLLLPGPRTVLHSSGKKILEVERVCCPRLGVLEEHMDCRASRRFKDRSKSDDLDK